jgi:hypothetical protein
MAEHLSDEESCARGAACENCQRQHLHPKSLLKDSDMFRMLSAAFLIGGLAVPALAQPFPPAPSTPYLNLPEMNYDLWCQEVQHLPPARCDKRLPDDDKAFNAYRNTVEKYEVPYYQQKQDDATVNRVILHSDPLINPADHESTPNPPQN